MTLYTLPYCPKCSAAHMQLDDNGYEYEIKNTTQEAREAGITSVPCLISDSGNKYSFKQIIQTCKGGGQFE